MGTTELEGRMVKKTSFTRAARKIMRLGRRCAISRGTRSSRRRLGNGQEARDGVRRKPAGSATGRACSTGRPSFRPRKRRPAGRELVWGNKGTAKAQETPAVEGAAASSLGHPESAALTRHVGEPRNAAPAEERMRKAACSTYQKCPEQANAQTAERTGGCRGWRGRADCDASRGRLPG